MSKSWSANFTAEREGCARSLRSLRLPRLRRGRRTNSPPRVGEGSHPSIPSFTHNVPGGERGIRTLDPVISGIHDFQSCPFGLSGISPLVNHLQSCSQSPFIGFAEREGCAHSLRSFRLPLRGAEPTPPQGRGRVLIPHSGYLHCYLNGGEGGIRTHVSFRENRFSRAAP